MEESAVSKKAELSAKILIIGNSEVGKSSILARFTDNYFSHHMQKTVGVDFKTKKVKVSKSEIKLQIWDTAGQERYRSITQTFYKNALGVLIVFDLTDTQSFTDLEGWITNLSQFAGSQVCKVLVGNKSDKKDAKVITDEEVKQFLQIHPMPYFETSAKEGTNIVEAFFEITKNIMERFYSDSTGKWNEGDFEMSQDGSDRSRYNSKWRSTLKKQDDAQNGTNSGKKCC